MPVSERVLTAEDMGAVNRVRLVRLLHREGPLSRARLASELDVSRATVGTIVQPLLDEGVLEVQDPPDAPSRVGKPARPLWFGRSRLIGCVYLSADELEVATATMDGAVLERRAVPMDEVGTSSGHRPIAARIADACAVFFAGRPLVGIGIAAAGMVDTDTGSVLTMYKRQEIHGLRIRDLLAETLGVAAEVDHHPRAQAIGDFWFGVGRRYTTFASLYTGEVLGGGFVHNGRILRGPHGAGGEIGHIVIDVDGDPCICGRVGCWETLATLPWLRREAAKIGLDEPLEITAGRLSTLASSDDRASELLDRYIDNFAQGVADLEHVLGTGTYLLHGDLADAGPQMARRIERRVRDLGPHRGADPVVVAIADDNTATLLGAAGLIMSTLYSLDVGF